MVPQPGFELLEVLFDQSLLLYLPDTTGQSTLTIIEAGAQHSCLTPKQNKCLKPLEIVSELSSIP